MIKKNIFLLSTTLILILGITQPAFSDPNTNSDTEHKVSVIKTEPIKYETRIVEDSQLPQGIEIVIQEGKDGEKTYFKDTEITKTKTETLDEIPVYYDTINKLPEEKVIRQGTKIETIKIVSDKTIQLEQEKEIQTNNQKIEENKKSEIQTPVEKTKENSVNNSVKTTSPATKSEKVDVSDDKSSQSVPISDSVDGNRVTTPEENRSYAQSILSPSDFTCADKLVVRESEWKTTAKNKSSGAYGVPQSLPGNKMASEGNDWQTNGKTQFNWMIKYVDGRYGGFCQALDHSYSKGWY